MPGATRTLAGVFVGKEVGNRLYAEELMQDRFVIRKHHHDGGLQRLGEVCGSNKTYIASRMSGQQVAKCGSFREAAFALTRV